MSESLTRPVTLVSAPPGFGKTTLLTEWIAQFKPRAAWLALDAGDNDPVRFWSYLIAALQQLDAGIGSSSLALLDMRAARSLDSMLMALVNEIDALVEDLALVLDDYHVIETASIHQQLSFLIDHLPPHLHVVIGSRADPPLHLARLRARDQLLELHQDDLRLTPAEVTLFLNETMGLTLTTEQVAALEARTEGWIAGLQLAALSLRGRKDSSSFVEAFAGSHRFILDYLTDEVLAAQTESVQTFLLQTSILERLNASLCNALTGRAEGQSTLEELEHHNLFVIALDDERRWYRYHHLFADVLRHRLAEKSLGAVDELHRMASTWFENEGLSAEAVGHALKAHDWERAARLIENAGEALRQRGETSTLAGWVEALPDSIRRSHPALCIEYARVLIDKARYPAGERFVREAEDALEGGEGVAQSEANALWGKIAALRAQLVMTQSDFAQAIALSQRAQNLLPATDRLWRSYAAFNLAGAFRFSSNWVAACETFLQAAELNESAGDYLGALVALSSRGEVLQAQGQLHQAVQQYEEVLELAQTWRLPKAPVLGYALAGLGRVFCEWNDLDAALSYTHAGLERGEQAGIMDISLRGYLVVARIREAQDDANSALAALDSADTVAEKMGVSEVKDWIDALRAQSWLARGDIQAAVDWANNFRGPVNDAVFPGVPQALAQVWLAHREPDKALPLLDHALQSARAVGRQGNVVHLLAVKALVQHAQGNPEQALATLGQALELAEPEGYIRAFVDVGMPMARLLQRMLTRSPSSDYVRRLLDAFGQPVRVEPPTPGKLAEPLSVREIQVLRLIADGATNKEIAQELVLTTNTVKKHIGNIFGKLQVSNRAQAIARARQLNLI